MCRAGDPRTVLPDKIMAPGHRQQIVNGLELTCLNALGDGGGESSRHGAMPALSLIPSAIVGCASKTTRQWWQEKYLLLAKSDAVVRGVRRGDRWF